jgi:hypothetical protein
MDDKERNFDIQIADLTFETKCWENDWRLMTCTNHLMRMIENCNVNFKEKKLYINNVDNFNKVKNYAKKLCKKKIIDSVLDVNDYSQLVLKEFNIDRSSFEGGYYYSIQELVGIYLCKTKYLLHFSSDSYIPSSEKESLWISQAIEIMEKNDDIIVANPTWNYKYSEAELESTGIINNFFLGQGFSDQCYLINVEKFKGAVYNYKHIDSERYPKYGGELFEKRVDAFMRVNDYKRITSMNTSYISKNITKFQILKEKIGFGI